MAISNAPRRIQPVSAGPQVYLLLIGIAFLILAARLFFLQIVQHRVNYKASLDNILRFRWKDPQNKVFYLGPGEGGDVSLELVQILDPENDTVTIYFDRLSKLPAKVEYRDVDKRGVHLRNVEEYSQWHVVQGVKLPLRIDGFVNGRKASQLFLTKITLSNNLLDSFFSKPVPPK